LSDKYRKKKARSLELKSVFHECTPGRWKLAVKEVDLFGNDTVPVLNPSNSMGLESMILIPTNLRV
jgi:hypothetical protein